MLRIALLDTPISQCYAVTLKRKTAQAHRHAYVQALECIEKRLEAGLVINIVTISQDIGCSHGGLVHIIESYPELGHLISKCKRHLGQKSRDYFDGPPLAPQ